MAAGSTRWPIGSRAAPPTPRTSCRTSSCRCYRRLDSFRGEAALGTWLHRLAVNASLDFVRSKQGRRQRVTDTAEDLDAIAAPANGPWRPDAALDRMDLDRAIAQLPPSYRRAFLLHDVEGLEHHEIGESLGIAEGTSKSLLFKARTRLRVILRGRSGVR